MEEIRTPRGGVEPVPPPEKPVVVYANAAKDRIVPAGSAEAAYVVNVEHPDEFEDLLPAAKAAGRQEDRQAERPAERTAEQEAAATKAGRKAEDK